MTEPLHTSSPVPGPPPPQRAQIIFPPQVSRVCTSLEPPAVTASGPFPKAAGSSSGCGGALLADGRADAQPAGSGGTVGSPGHRAGAAAAAAAEGRPPRLTFADPVQPLPLDFVPVHGPGGAAPPSAPRRDPGPGTGRPRRCAGTGNAHRAHASGSAAAETRALPLPVRAPRACGGAGTQRGRAGQGRARQLQADPGSFGTPGAQPAWGTLGLQGLGHEGDCRERGGG